MNSASPLMDFPAILKASQEIAGEIELNSLSATMLGIVIEKAGAQTGFLLMVVEGRWMIVAGGYTTRVFI
jgi:hypothetical protein